MRLVSIDLKNIVAIGHAEGYLGLLLDREGEKEYVEIPAPSTVYKGLQKIAYIANNEVAYFSTIKGEKPIAMLSVRSTMASAIGYDESRQILQIEFLSGTIYQYLGVEREIWESFRDSSSKGKFFNQEIKGQYASLRVDKNRVEN
ncbi:MULTISPECIES: KTSC domain-containing protein [Aerosakkonema]|uniref:KTSC domain-containing protein n=1 Tax=Aerosakkonema TaxID=1246629 RepID=UPI0035BB12D4